MSDAEQPGYTKDELRKIYGHLVRLLPPGGRPPTAEEVVEINALIDKTRAMIASSAGLYARGRKIFEWRIHAKDAPTQNEIRGLVFGSPFALKSKEERLDRLLALAIENEPEARVRGKAKRWVRVTRFSPSKVDDPSAVDAIGGKMPVDALVRAGVLHDDNEAHCRREGGYRKTKKGNVHVLVEVFHMAEEEVPDPGPVDAVMPPRKPLKKSFTHSVLEGAEAIPANIEATALLGKRRKLSKRGNLTRSLIRDGEDVK